MSKDSNNTLSLKTNKHEKLLKITLISVILIAIIFSREILRYTVGYAFRGGFYLLGKMQNDFGKVLRSSGDAFWKGMETTIFLALLGTLIGFVISIIGSYVIIDKIDKYDSKFTKIRKRVLTFITKIYVTVIRSTPMLCQAMVFYYSIGIFQLGFWRQLDPNFKYLMAGLLTVSINTGAYLIEVLRGSLESIDKGQLEAARALGMSRFLSYLKIIYPQALKTSIPSIGNEFIINLKDTSVLSVIMVVDIFRVAQEQAGKLFLPDVPYLIAAGLYLILTLSFSTVLGKIAKKMKIKSKALPSCN
jgi:putative lysine transport system permease protein